MINKRHLFAPLGLLSLAVITGALLISSTTYADDSVVDEINITVPISCSLEGAGMTSHNANIVNGTYQADIGSTTLKAFCNDSDGFAIYAIGYTDNEYGKTVLTNTTLGSTYDIATGTATSGSTSNWAMKLATDGTATYAITLDNSFNAYHAAPTSYTKVAHRDSGTDIGTGATGASLTSTYAAFMSQTQPAGTYTGQVKYTLVHPSTGPTPVQPLADSDCPANSICFAPNANDIEGSMSGVGESMTVSVQAGKVSDIPTNETFSLWAHNYSRSGYGFAGWSTSFDADANSGTDLIYGPQANVSTDPNNQDYINIATKGLILYPVWVESAGSMQTFSSTDCNTMVVGEVTARTDSRDNDTYAIAKLADNKCWMIENLRLDNDANITTMNTQSNNGAWGGVFTGLAEPDENFGGTQANSLYSTDGSTANVISDGDSRYWYGRFPRYDNINTNRSYPQDDGYSSNWYSYGNYYSWAAAIADTSLYNINNQSIENTSICPSGWRLPIAGDKTNYDLGINDFYALGTALGSSAPTTPSWIDDPTVVSWIDDDNTIGTDASRLFRAFPNNFLYSGWRDFGWINDRNAWGNYHSSTVSDNRLSYYLFLSNDTVSSEDNQKWGGRSIRCIAGN